MLEHKYAMQISGNFMSQYAPQSVTQHCRALQKTALKFTLQDVAKLSMSEEPNMSQC